MKKRLGRRNDLNVLLLVLWNMAAHTDRMAEAQIKHFTAFFPTEGNSLEYGNIMKAKIAEVTGAECEELWRPVRPRSRRSIHTLPAADIRTSYRGKKTYTKQRH